METISIQTQDKIAILKLDHGITNTINLDLVQEFHITLGELEVNPNIQGLVITSNNSKFFSIGFDIPNLYPLPKDDFKNFYVAFNQLALALYTFPKPTITAINGHAIAGGCILALCCDYRFIAEGRKLMGLNEIKLGVPVPYLADCILRDLIGSRKARDILELGEFHPPEELLPLGMVDEILPPDELLPASIDKVKSLGEMPSEAYTLIKHNRVKAIEADMQTNFERKKDQFIECWYSPEARKLIEAAIEKF